MTLNHATEVPTLPSPWKPPCYDNDRVKGTSNAKGKEAGALVASANGSGPSGAAAAARLSETPVAAKAEPVQCDVDPAVAAANGDLPKAAAVSSPSPPPSPSRAFLSDLPLPAFHSQFVAECKQKDREKRERLARSRKERRMLEAAGRMRK